jgi:hypothetical protein
MANEEIVDDRSTEVSGPVWSPAQLIGLIIGIFFVVLGVVAVNRSGFDTDHIYTPHIAVWHLPHSPLLAVSEIGFGILVILASVVPGASRVAMTILGAIALVFGIIVLANGWQADLTHWLAASHRTGWLFTIAGAVLILTAWLMPVFVPGMRRRHRHVRSAAV